MHITWSTELNIPTNPFGLKYFIETNRDKLRDKLDDINREIQFVDKLRKEIIRYFKKELGSFNEKQRTAETAPYEYKIIDQLTKLNQTCKNFAVSPSNIGFNYLNSLLQHIENIIQHIDNIKVAELTHDTAIATVLTSILSMNRLTSGVVCDPEARLQRKINEIEQHARQRLQLNPDSDSDSDDDLEFFDAKQVPDITEPEMANFIRLNQSGSHNIKNKFQHIEQQKKLLQEDDIYELSSYEYDFIDNLTNMVKDWVDFATNPKNIIGHETYTDELQQRAEHILQLIDELEVDQLNDELAEPMILSFIQSVFDLTSEVIPGAQNRLAYKVHEIIQHQHLQLYANSTTKDEEEALINSIFSSSSHFKLQLSHLQSDSKKMIDTKEKNRCTQVVKQGRILTQAIDDALVTFTQTKDWDALKTSLMSSLLSFKTSDAFQHNQHQSWFKTYIIIPLQCLLDVLYNVFILGQAKTTPQLFKTTVSNTFQAFEAYQQEINAIINQHESKDYKGL